MAWIVLGARKRATGEYLSRIVKTLHKTSGEKNEFQFREKIYPPP
jgi:hypothetical protein